MNKITYLTLFLLSVFIISCGDDEDGSGVNSNNTNANQYISENIYTETGHTTEATNAIHRLEIPKLVGGDCAFVAHYTGAYGLNYSMEYDVQKRANRWVAYEWYASNSVSNWNRNNWGSWNNPNGQKFNGYGGNGDPYQPDPILPTKYQTTLAEHQNNGYDRGHMLGSADRLCDKESNGQTFYLSNMHPQLNNFNSAGIWYSLEGWLRSYNTSSKRDTLYVVKGGTIADGQIKEVKNGLVVPKYFFMAILCKTSSSIQGGYKAIGFWMEHKGNSATVANNYKDYAVSIDRLEELTGIDFFCNLPDDVETKVESNLATNAWGLK